MSVSRQENYGAATLKLAADVSEGTTCCLLKSFARLPYAIGGGVLGGLLGGGVGAMIPALLGAEAPIIAAGAVCGFFAGGTAGCVVGCFANCKCDSCNNDERNLNTLKK